MILNVKNNGKILKDALGLELEDLTVLTGENGSGKTQLLNAIKLNVNGYQDLDEMGMPLYIEGVDNTEPLIIPLLHNNGEPIKEVIYSYPGLQIPTPIQYQTPPKTLIQVIREQWQSLSLISTAHNVIKHRTFNDENSELQAINQSISNLVNQAIQTSNNQSGPTIKTINLHELKRLKQVAERSGKILSDINFIDYLIFYPIPLDIFSAALDLLFHQFSLKQNYYSDLTEGITPPLDVFNEILDAAKFKYRADYQPGTNEEHPGIVKLVDRHNGNDISFEDLSSGETTIMALIFALYNSSNNGRFPEAILFDEPDAHLHPSLTQLFLDVIKDVLVKEHRVNVILTTHSPSTVALAPEESIFRMDRDLGYPVKENRQAAINALSSGLATLTVEESNLGLVYNIKQTTKHILFTEGITDKIILETAWNKLYDEESMPFYIQDCFCASFLGNLFTQGDQSPDGIFHQFSDRKMIALFDFDQAGYAEWNNKKKFPAFIEEDPRKCLTRSNSSNGFMLLLPSPNIPGIINQVVIEGNITHKDKSILTIELLFFNSPSLKQYFIEQLQPGGGKIYSANGRTKKQFAQVIKDLPIEDFKEFVPLFEKIKELLK